ncbi:MAG: LLM class F420-dependent oxidoreductase [Actinomycetota bacterium]|nr:MAG: LLM class F420-dependent oxidoreductase [Actinomycetota bacterium]
MQISMQVNYSASFLPAVDQIIAYEKRGLDIAWVPEAYGFDSPTLMGFLAAKTDRVKIGAGIMPIYSRTPALIAQTAAGLDEVSKGRAILGLGASGPQVIEGWHGVTYDKPIARTREIINICRHVWAREPLVNDGIYQIPLPQDKGTGLGKPLKIITTPVRANIPIFVASLGFKNVEMTFAEADGWLPIFYVPEKAKEVWGSAIESGMEKRNPALGPPEIVGGGMLAVGEHLEDLREMGRGVLALYIGGMGAKGRNFYNDLAVRYGYGEQAKKIQDLYLSGEKTKAMAEIPSELLEATSLIGPRSYIAERLAAHKESGVTIMGVTPVGSDPLGSFESFAEMVREIS